MGFLKTGCPKMKKEATLMLPTKSDVSVFLFFKENYISKACGPTKG